MPPARSTAHGTHPADPTPRRPPFVPVPDSSDPRRALGRAPSDQPRGQRARAPGTGCTRPAISHNLELAAGLDARGEYVNDLPFLDSDLYKWLEAIGWTLADPGADRGHRGRAARASRRRHGPAAAGSRPPTATWTRTSRSASPESGSSQLRWGHELYCAGHLIQAAVAVHRSTGDDRLLDMARRFADLIARVVRHRRRPGRRRLRPSRDRDRLGRAAPRDRRASATCARRSTSSTAAATACWATARSAPTTGKITSRSARRRRWRATRCGSSTCWPGWPTWRRDRRRALREAAERLWSRWPPPRRT